MCVCVYVCMDVSMCVCVCGCIYVCVCVCVFQACIIGFTSAAVSAFSCVACGWFLQDRVLCTVVLCFWFCRGAATAAAAAAAFSAFILLLLVFVCF